MSLFARSTRSLNAAKTLAQRCTALALITGVVGCTTLPSARLASPADPAPPSVTIARSSDGTEASTTLDVLTYNIEGLGWPARRGRAPSLEQIGATLHRLNASGEAPDVILVQEMFSPAAVRAITGAGYRYLAWGPSRTQRRRSPIKRKMSGPASWGKGEIGFHLVGSGLAVLSRFPIVFNSSEPFGTRHCAGFDCLSNKGVQHVRIAVPGVPQPVDIFNAHLNSRSASRVSVERSGAAHALQVDDVASFMASTSNPGRPTILGGDFNMRGDPQRLARFESALRNLTMVQRYCVAPANVCEIRISWDGDAPWMDTEDLQLFRDGSSVAVTPVRVEAMFDGSEQLPRLSDHDAFRVRYRLGWLTSNEIKGAAG